MCSILFSNAFTGPIPSELGNLDHLWRFFVENNDLNGELPIEINKWSDITEFNVAMNSLSGAIPNFDSANVSLMEIFNFTGNDFVGEIPLDLCLVDEFIFDFDCSETLCGCWCDCPSTTTTNVTSNATTIAWTNDLNMTLESGNTDTTANATGTVLITEWTATNASVNATS